MEPSPMLQSKKMMDQSEKMFERELNTAAPTEQE
jgi:hypothetical protein